MRLVWGAAQGGHASLKPCPNLKRMVEEYGGQQWQCLIRANASPARMPYAIAASVPTGISSSSLDRLGLTGVPDLRAAWELRRAAGAVVHVLVCHMGLFILSAGLMVASIAEPTGEGWARLWLFAAA